MGFPPSLSTSQKGKQMESSHRYYLTSIPTGRLSDALNTEEQIKFLFRQLADENDSMRTAREAAKFMAERYGYKVTENNLSSDDFDELIGESRRVV